MNEQSAASIDEETRSIYGDEHHKTLTAYLKMIEKDTSDYEAYSDKLFLAGDVADKLRDSRDPDAIHAMLLYADMLSDFCGMPSLSEYEAIYEWVLELGDAGRAHLAHVQSTLFDVYYELEFYDEAEEIGEKLLAFLRENTDTYGNSHLFCIYELARNEFMDRKFEKAQERLEHLYENEREAMAEENMLADLSYNLAACCIYTKDFDKAEKLANEAAELYDDDKEDRTASLSRCAKGLAAKANAARTLAPDENIGGFLILRWLKTWVQVLG